jgi:pimeloyl-ACP methyl ester carboxylesterase
MTIDVLADGDGPLLWLIHGAIADPEVTWERQLPLRDRWTVGIVRRPGFGGPGPSPAGSDWIAEGDAVAELLEQPTHLVGHSYGAMVALQATSSRPNGVQSLTVVEPPVYSLVRGDPDVERWIADVERTRRDTKDDTADALDAFSTLIGLKAGFRRPLPAALARRVRLFLGERLPWEGPLDIETVVEARVPTLVVSGDWSPPQVRAADELAAATGGERVIIAGGHNIHRHHGEFNPLLERFLRLVEANLARGSA